MSRGRDTLALEFRKNQQREGFGTPKGAVETKRGVAPRHALSMGTAGGTAGLGDTVLVGLGRLFLPCCRNAVGFTQPAAEVDQPAAVAAERPERKVLRTPPLANLVADRAT